MEAETCDICGKELVPAEADDGLCEDCSYDDRDG